MVKETVKEYQRRFADFMDFLDPDEIYTLQPWQRRILESLETARKPITVVISNPSPPSYFRKACSCSFEHQTAQKARTKPEDRRN